MSILDFNFFENLKLKINIAFSSKGIPVCETRVMRGKRGMPWNERIAVHPLQDGKLEITKVDLP